MVLALPGTDLWPQPKRPAFHRPELRPRHRLDDWAEEVSNQNEHLETECQSVWPIGETDKRLPSVG